MCRAYIEKLTESWRELINILDIVLSKVYFSLNQYINRVLGQLDSVFNKLSKRLEEQNFERLMRMKEDYKRSPNIFLNVQKTSLNSLKAGGKGAKCVIKF